MAKSGMSENDSDGNTDPQQQQAATQLNVAKKSNQQPEIDVPSSNAVAHHTDTIANPIMHTSMPISIVIQSLVQSLCYNYQPDDKKAHATYKRICEMLYDMMVIDDSYSMKEFEGIRNQCQRVFHQLLTCGDGHASATSTALQHPMMVWSDDVCNEWSHYKREFDELGFIAGGGFGKVFRVRHKLDDTEYAVKKIFIKANSIESVRAYLAEAKTFASLNHSNIVQYKAAWLELGAVGSNGDAHAMDEDEEATVSTTETDLGEENGVDEDMSGTSIFNDIYRDLDNEYMEQESTSDFDICFENSRHYSLTHTRKVQKRRVKRNSASEGGNAICKLEDIRRLQAKHHPKWATLFIQMSLCHSTLKQWLENRNTLESANRSAVVPLMNTRRFSTVMEILRQLLIGLAYIHSKGIVHHDIKPSNIFMQVENNALLVQLGDFGLACPRSSQHTLAGGTKLYAAPEQLAGKCDPKSDMYSLGIVVFELTETFSTDMERIANITGLRKGVVPPSTRQLQPQLADIIGQLVVRQLANRPDAPTLLKLVDAQTSDDLQLRELQTKVVEQESQLAEKDLEIRRLTEELSRLKNA